MLRVGDIVAKRGERERYLYWVQGVEQTPKGAVALLDDGKKVREDKLELVRGVCGDGR